MWRKQLRASLTIMRITIRKTSRFTTSVGAFLAKHGAVAAIALIVLGLPLAVLGYEHLLRPVLAETRVIDIRAAAPEAGGFQPDSIQVAAGEPVTLRFHSTDVVHGVALGPGLGIDLGDIDPGQVKEVTVIFDEPGVYTFYCNTWCSDDHWRMRGVIEVRDPAHPDTLPALRTDPVIEALATAGVDIDTWGASGQPPDRERAWLPLADRSPAAMSEGIVVPHELRDAGWRFSHTPASALERLQEANPTMLTDELADLVAYLWVEKVPAEAADLYNKNCAACHGQTGDGNGPASGTTPDAPVAFADPAYMFEMRGDVLYAKIRRGGMGTGMPNFGTVFTQEETRALVAYLWKLAFAPTDTTP